MEPSRTEYIDGKFLRVYDNIFSHEDIIKFNHSMLIANFSCLQASKEETRKYKEWVATFDSDDFKNHWLAKACETILSTMPETKDKKYKLGRTFCNLFSFGSYTFSHCDSADTLNAASEISFLYLANYEWDHEWGGETIFFDQSFEPKLCVGVKPGRLVVFTGDMNHRAGIPTRYCEDHRLSFSLRYTPC